MEKRINREIAEKEGLLRDIENPVDLKLMPMKHHKELLISARKYGLSYGVRELDGDETANAASYRNSNTFHDVLQDFDFELRQGERIFLKGENGCGKSSFIKAVLARNAEKIHNDSNLQNEWMNHVKQSGILETASGLIISYIHQDTSHLKGKLTDFCVERNLDESLLKAILRQLDFERVQFSKNMEDFSEGQKKKVLIAAGLLTQAHLYIWDEPLNYIDVFSRMQIEDVILRYQPTMLVVDHDVRFQEKIATRVVEMNAKGMKR